MNTKNEIVIYHGMHGDVVLNADIKHDTIWATHQEIASLFGVDRSGVTRHSNKILASGEVDEKSNVQKMHITNADRPAAYYSLDRILAIGYRVNSAEEIDFRKWATAILKQYLINGYAVNEKRLAQVNKLLQIVSRSGNVCARGEDAGDC